MPVGDPTAVQVVRAQLHLDLVARQDANVVLSHLPGDGCEHRMAAVDLNPEHRARQGLDDLSFDLDLLFLCRHILFLAAVFVRTATQLARSVMVAEPRRSWSGSECLPRLPSR